QTSSACRPSAMLTPRISSSIVTTVFWSQSPTTPLRPAATTCRRTPGGTGVGVAVGTTASALVPRQSTTTASTIAPAIVLVPNSPAPALSCCALTTVCRAYTSGQSSASTGVSSET